MTAVDCMIIGVIIMVLGFTFGVTGSLLFKKFSIQDRFINIGGYLVGAGIIIAVLAWIYYIGTILM